MRRVLVVGAAIAALSCSLTVWAQQPASPQPPSENAPSARFTLRGTVLDPMRSAIAGATVDAVADGSASRASVVTDERGQFSLVLPPGVYVLTVKVAGFRDASQRLAAAAASTETRDFVMEVAGLRDSVTVNAPATYQAPIIRSATKTATPLRDVPQSITVITQDLIKDQAMLSVGDVVKYVPGITQHQGENNRDQLVIRGNSTSADFFVNGVRDDVQYYRDLYNLDRVEALKGPNAMIFGRGGAGGVVNRVTKEAGFLPLHEFSLQGGSFDNRRGTLDVDMPLSQTVAVRLNGMYEDSNSFRSSVGLTRFGVSPTLTIAPSSRTKIVFDDEYLNDQRVADRGVSSFQGRPLNVDPSTYFGNPLDSHVNAYVHLASATVEHRTGSLLIRNHTLVGHYDRGYQNFVPGAVNASQTQAALTAYNNATLRTNLFNQTDVTYVVSTGRLRHTLLAGAEVGRQLTDNFRNTGFFNNTATSIQVPLSNTVIAPPVTFRQSATDADNHLRTIVAATYAQDQVELSDHVQVIAGLRFDRFDLQYHNNRNGDTLTRPDNLVSPRAGVVVKPMTALSLYGIYSVSYLPSSGDQFSSLTTITQQVEPERFNNYEVGVKWDARPMLALTTAVYRLDRTNTRSTDPNDPARIIQTGSQRTNGYEIGVNGRLTSLWRVVGGYAYQDAFVSSATTAATAGAQVGEVPHHTFSLWNHYQVHPRLAGGIGVIYRSDMFAAIDNTVTLPGYVRAAAAGFFTVSKDLRLQVNVENLLDKRYFLDADSNTNISPGSPRTVRVGLTVAF